MDAILALITIFYATPRLWLLLEDFLHGGVERAILNGGRRFAKDCFVAVAAVFAAYWTVMDIGLWIGPEAEGVDRHALTLKEYYPASVTIFALGYFWGLIWLWRLLWGLGQFVWAFMLVPFVTGLRGRDA